MPHITFNWHVNSKNTTLLLHPTLQQNKYFNSSLVSPRIKTLATVPFPYPFPSLTCSRVQTDGHHEVILEEDKPDNREEVHQNERQDCRQQDGPAILGDRLDDVQQRLLPVDDVKQQHRVEEAVREPEHAHHEVGEVVEQLVVGDPLSEGFLERALVAHDAGDMDALEYQLEREKMIGLRRYRVFFYSENDGNSNI